MRDETRPLRPPHNGEESDEDGPVVGQTAEDPSNAPVSPPPCDREVDINTWRISENNRYTVVTERARGGLGRILEANDQVLDRPVAIKELLRGGGEARFVREALITARLQHPSIVPIHDLGRWPNGKPYYAMKMVSGRSLAELIGERKRLEDRLALLSNVIAVADAMAYAHGQRIIHRDLKPANVLIGPFGETVVIDWGLAADLSKENRSSTSVSRPYQVAAAALTMDGVVMGTAEYMPLEQAEGKPVDERGDVYAIGAILYHLLAGTPPYDGKSSQEVMEKLTREPPLSLRQREPRVPKELATIIGKAMARDPIDRYPTAKELAEDLRRFQTGQLVGAHRYSPATLIGRWIGRHRTSLVALAVSLALSCAVGVVNLWRSAREQKLSLQQRNELLLLRARSLLDRDPTAAIAMLKNYPDDAEDWQTARDVALEAKEKGVASHIFKSDSLPVAFSADGTVLALGGGGDAIRLLDVSAGKVLSELPHQYAVQRFALSPDARRVLLVDRYGRVHLWDRVNRKIETIGVHEDTIGDPVFSPQGELAATFGSDRTIRIWSTDSGSSRVFRAQGIVSAMRFSPDGRRIAWVGGNGIVRVLDLVTNQAQSFKVKLNEILLLRFSPKGNLLAAAGCHKTIRLVHLATGEVDSLEFEAKEITDLRFSPDSAVLASRHADGTAVLWPMGGGERRVLGSVSNPIYSLDFSADGRFLATGSQQGAATIWDAKSGGPLQDFIGHTSPVDQLLFSPDGHLLLSASLDKTARLWRLPPSVVVARAFHEELHQVEFALDGRHYATLGWVLSTGVGDIRLGDLSTGEMLVLSGQMVTKAAFSSDSDHLASVSRDGEFKLWNVRTHSAVVHDIGPGVWDFEVSGDGSRVAHSNRRRHGPDITIGHGQSLAVLPMFRLW